MNQVEKFKADLEEENELLRREKELKTKRLILNERRTEVELEKVLESDKSQAINRDANFSHVDSATIQSMVDESNQYMEAARNSMEFISPDFSGVVPFYSKNLILLLGKTGDGKSTTVANIVRNVISQTNPVTGKPRRVLVLTNEERAADLYNRITCCGRKWAYVNHGKFTSQQINILNDSLRYMAGTGLVTIVDDNHGGAQGTTTTIEGLKDLFDNLIKNKIHYDAVIIDYYQKINSSRQDIGADEYKIQDRVRQYLDHVKNVYPAPIIVLAQMKPNGKEDEAGYRYRIEGTKAICNSATFIMEMIRDTQRFRTEWVVHKSRYTAHTNTRFFTGFDRGRFVPYTPEFQTQISNLLEERAAETLQNLAGIRESDGG